jgi:hypothetical protein
MKQGLMIFTMMFMLVGCAEKNFEGNESPSQLADANTPAGSNFGSEGLADSNGSNSTAPNVPSAPNLPPSANCNSTFIVGTVTSSPAGVSLQILKAYDDILGRIDIYEAGGLYLTNLQAVGFTVTSLRRDLVKTPEHAALLERIYNHHLKRLPTTYETSLHFNDLVIESTNMRQIEVGLYARCLRGG